MADTSSFSLSGNHSLEQRLRHLEEQARFTLDVLEMASTLGDFQTSINKLHEPTALLEETILRIGELVHFPVSAFYLVDEASSDFVLSLCRPSDFADELETEVRHLIDNGVFSLAVRENRPITVYSRDNRYRLVLHVLATTSRTRGMFVGLMPKGERNLSGILLSLLSIVLKHCANAIESFELYRLVRQGEREPREALDSLPVAVFDVTGDGGVVYANNCARRLAVAAGAWGALPLGGAGDDRMAGFGLHLLVVAEDRPVLQALLESCRAGELPEGTTLRLAAAADAEHARAAVHACAIPEQFPATRVRCVFSPLENTAESKGGTGR